MHLTDVAQRLRPAAAAVDRPRVVAGDGRGGAGTSTLVEALAAHVPGSVVVHTDDIGWHHAFFDWADLLVTHVLGPVHGGEAVDHRPRAWKERGRPGSVVVPAGVDTVWVEGTGVVREQLRPWLDASVWVQVDRGEAERRLRARDGTSPGSAGRVFRGCGRWTTWDRSWSTPSGRSRFLPAWRRSSACCPSSHGGRAARHRPCAADRRQTAGTATGGRRQPDRPDGLRRRGR